MKKILSYIGQILVVIISIFLFFYVAHSFSMYDIETSDGSDDACWRIPGGLHSMEIFILCVWGFYLIHTGVQILLYLKGFQKNKVDNHYWAVPILDIKSNKVASCILSIFFIIQVLWLDYIMLEVFHPKYTYTEMSQIHWYSGMEWSTAIMIELYWFVFTLCSGIHLLLIGLYRRH